MNPNHAKDTFDLKAFLKNLTTQPGVYQMLDANGKVLYVGKARHLKNRVSSYFRGQDQSPKTLSLLRFVVRIEVTVTHSENEALLLESNLIKQLKPRYNILLRDDKSYPYLYLTADTFPQLTFYRGKTGKTGRYFGPYPSSGAVRETLNLLQKLFRLRSCNNTFFQSRTRPCLQYQIKRCTAPCVNYISEADYQEAVTHAILFLEGKNQQVIDTLIEKMELASQQLHYEQAAHYRDLVISLRKVQEQQFISQENGEVDVIAISLSQGYACVQVMTIRGGRLLGSKSYFPDVPEGSSKDEILSAFIPQYYVNPVRIHQIPALLIVSEALSDQTWLTDFLSEHRGKSVSISHRVRTERAQWLKLALQNAELSLQNHMSNKANSYQRFEALQASLKLDAVPERLECFDISHTSGEATVASCVVFDINGPLSSDYRRFNIKDITPGDDYAALYQALMRRYQKVKEGEGVLPDVLFIDGGKGQLHQAEKVFQELQIKGVFLVGVAKGPGRISGLEQLYLPGHEKPLHLSEHSKASHLIQHIRDEAHRFAITGHRKQRAKQRKISDLEQIEGIGAKRRRELLRQMGGLQELKAASVREIAKVSGISQALAERIYAALHPE
jgi:excinuclease ABC subunit C